MTSAGLLLYRYGPAESGDDPADGTAAGELQVLLGHMGGPFWMRKDDHAWSIPKGEYDPDEEDPAAVAIREFTEEMGSPPPGTADDDLDLGVVQQRGGRKTVRVWARQGDFDPTTATSNTFDLQWPPGSGKTKAFPEVDRVEWMTIEQARPRVVAAQAEFLDRLVAALDSPATR